MTSHRICDGNVAALNGGNVSCPSAGTAVPACVSPSAAAGAVSCAKADVTNISFPCPYGGAAPCGPRRQRVLLLEDQEQRDEEREDAQGFGHGEAEDQAAELA